MKKRLLALILCLVMVIGLVPTALAVDDGKDDDNMIRVDYLFRGDVPTGFVNQQEYYAVDELVTPVSVTEPNGYSFDGWYLCRSDGTVDKIKTISNFYAKENVTLIGFWTHTGGTTLRHVTYKQAKDIDIDTIEIPVEDGQETNAIFYPDDKWTLPENTLFAGWSNGINTYQPGDSLGIVTDDITLWATYKNVSILSISYFDYETQTTKIASVKYGDSVTINPGKGTAFLGKTPVTTAKAYIITDDATLTIAETTNKVALGWTYDPLTKTFTAVWEDTATEYTVTFYCWYDKKNETQKFASGTKIVIDPNGGKFLYKGSYTTDETTFYLTSDYKIENAKRTGYTFYGWKATEDTRTKTVTFTAQWTKDYPYYNTYSIYYYDYDDCKSEYANFPYGTSVVIDPNGGTAKLSGTSFSTKQSFNIYRDYTLTDASRSGYTFYGWDLTKSGSTYYFTAMWSRYKSDVPYMLNGTDHYAYIKGYPNGSFKPTDTITRAEAATIFYRLLTDSTRKAYATTYNSFKDVPATAWYNTAVSTMAKLGIVNGGADGYFRPNDPITRAEIAAMIARCDGAYYTGTSTVFSDTYGHWAASYIARAYELGWINGYGTTYAPDRYISRAETVAVLNRVLNRAPQYTSDLTRNYTTFSDVATSAWYYLDVEEAANSHTYTRKSNADYETWTKLIADPSWF